MADIYLWMAYIYLGMGYLYLGMAYIHLGLAYIYLCMATDYQKMTSILLTHLFTWERLIWTHFPEPVGDWDSNMADAWIK